jgi:hypothetical protein
MKLENKVLIIDSFAFENDLDAKYLIGQTYETLAEDFIKEHELGVSLAKVLTRGYCTITPAGVEVINETFEAVCNEMEVDSSKEYSDIADLHDEWRRINQPE